MAIRKEIVWTVAEDGVSFLPAAPQYGGVQGEDNAVCVKFALGTQHPLVNGGKYTLYIECEDPTGAYDKTQPITPDKDGVIEAPVPLAWTQYGGTVKLYVVAEGVAPEGAAPDKVILESVQLFFRNRNGFTRRMQALIQTYIQKLLDKAENVLNRATNAASNALGAANTAVTAAGAAETSAADAEEYCSAAMAMRNECRAYKSDCEESATAAAESAAEAQKAAEDAAADLGKASEKATEAAALAATATDNANVAKQAASAATATATTAKQKAEEAQLAAEKARITVDGELNTESENPVENRVVAREIYRLLTGAETTHTTAQNALDKANAAGSIAQTTRDKVDYSVIPRLIALEQNGTGGGIAVTDDGEGNVTITASAGVSITDDGQGNVTIV